MNKPIGKVDQAKIDFTAEQLARIFIEQIKHKKQNKLRRNGKYENSKD